MTSQLIDWRWVLFQVALPLGGPILLSALFVLGWWSTDPRFTPDWTVVWDLTPWAIAVYSLTLIGGTFERAWKSMEQDGAEPPVVAVARGGCQRDLLCFSCHPPPRSPIQSSASAYVVTLILMLASIAICYHARDRGVSHA